jgi:hypothetical protein
MRLETTKYLAYSLDFVLCQLGKARQRQHVFDRVFRGGKARVVYWDASVGLRGNHRDSEGRRRSIPH